jgi:hypothetical protein
MDLSETSGLWQCPACGNWFVTANMSHACGKYDLETLFARSEAQVFQLYRRLEALVQGFGPVRVIPQKTRVAFQVRVRFLAVYPRKASLLCGFWFTHRKADPRFFKIEQYTPRAIGHYLHLRSEEDFDEQFLGWLGEAYAIGQQRHLGR